MLNVLVLTQIRRTEGSAQCSRLSRFVQPADMILYGSDCPTVYSYLNLKQLLDLHKHLIQL